MQTIKDYQGAINKYGISAWFGTARGTLSGTYGNALSAWKSLAGLGALSGADFELAENAVPKPGSFRSNSVAKAKIESSLKNALDQAEFLTQRLAQNYPQAAPLLQDQLDQMKVMAYPDKYKIGSDGQAMYPILFYHLPV